MRRFCPHCGAPTGGASGCSACGRTWWSNPVASAAAVIVHNADILLVRRARQPFEGAWDLPGGFVEVGETAEGCLVREVLEETGVRASIVGYLGSWVDDYASEDSVDETSPTLNLVFRAEVDPAAAVVASEEGETRWWPLRALPPIAFPTSTGVVVRQVMEYYADGPVGSAL